MGSLAYLLFHYNQLRSPRTFVLSARETRDLMHTSLFQFARVWLNGLLALTFKNDRYDQYFFLSPHGRVTVAKYLTKLAPDFFLFVSEAREGSTDIFEDSFRRFKYLLKPFIHRRNFTLVSSRYKRFLRLSSLRRGLFFCFVLEEHFLTYNSRFMLSMGLSRWLSPWAQFYLFFFKLLTYDYDKLKWGLFNYNKYRTLSYYRLIGAFRKRTRNRALFYADGLIDYLDEEDFPDLVPDEIEYRCTSFAAQPVVASTATYSLPDKLIFYSCNEQENKSRYARNRQTYRTGVLWCLWLTVFTIALPSYLWYGITVKFTYLWPVFIGGFVSTLFFYYGRTCRWSSWHLADLVCRTGTWLKK